MLTSKFLITKKVILIIVSLLLWGTSFGQIPATISSSGTWYGTSGSGPITFAAGSCYSVTVTAWGGGGGGGGAANEGASGGGAGGGYAQGVVSVSGGSICYYSIGAGGTAGTTAGNNGGDGGPTWFNGTTGINNNTTGSYVNASGGAGGNGANTNVGAAAQTNVGTGTFGAPGVTATVSYSGGTGGGGFVNGGGDGGGGGGGGGAGAGGNGGNGATTTTGGAGAFGCPNGGGGGGGGGGGATGPGANGNPGNANGGGGAGGAANGGGAGGTGSSTAAGVLGTGTTGGAGVAFGGGGGAGNGCCGCNGGAGGDGAPGSGSIGGGGGGGTGDGGGGNGGNGGAHGGGGAGADGGSSASGGNGGAGYITITVAMIPLPTATAGPVLAAICASATSAAMGGSVSAGATGLWTGGAGTWTNATDPANATYTAGPSETGTVTLTLTATNTCGTNTATKTITINPAPATPTVTSPLTYCQNATATTLAASATGSLLWYTVATGGTGSTTAPTPSTAVTGSTTYYVSQTQTGCESPRASIVVTVIPSPTATASNTGPYCTDGIIVLSATGGNSYSWSCSNGYTGIGASPAPFSAAPYGAGTFTYSVTVTAANACTASASTSIVVNTTTIPNSVTANANLTTPCAGDTLKLIGLATGASQWSWTGPGGFTSTVQNPITVAPVTGTYTLTASNTCGTAANTASVSVTVDNLSASISGTLSYCNGANTTLTANPSGAVSYAWNNGNSTITTSASVSGNPYQVTVTDANGCSATATATVSVDNPTAAISGTLGFCPGGSTILTASGGTGYLWSDAANSTTQSITVSTAGPYSVTVTDATGCTASTTATVAISPVPLAPTVTSPVTYCQNATVASLTATAPGSLLWYTAATGGTGSTTAPTPSTADSGSTTYYVSQILNGCESPRDSIVVVINLTPTAIASNTGPYCTSGSITLSASGGATYSWSGLNGYTSTGASPTPFSAAAADAGTYTVTVTSVAGCTATAITNVIVGTPTTSAIAQMICSGQSITFSGQSIATAGTYYDTLTNAAGCDSIIGLTLTVLPDPVAAFSIQPTGDSAVYGTSISLTNSSLNADSVQWFLNNQAISLLSGNTLPVSDTGLYCISLSASNALGCSNISAPQCIQIYTYGPQSFYVPNAFTPNDDGINDNFEIFGKKDLIKYLSVRIYNRWGEKVFESFDGGFIWDGSYKGKEQSDGVYVYVLDITLLTGQSISQRGSLTLIR